MKDTCSSKSTSEEFSENIDRKTADTMATARGGTERVIEDSPAEIVDPIKRRPKIPKK
jgi:hypothetical protein